MHVQQYCSEQYISSLYIIIPLQEEESNSSNVGNQKVWSYTVKVINPNGMGGYELHTLDTHETFLHVQDMKESILSNCQEYIEKDKKLQFGYVVPGHGKKGKQLEITSDDDLRGMYPRHKKGTKILLWMKQTVTSTIRKRSRTPDETQESSVNKRFHTSSEIDSSTSGGRKSHSNYDKYVEKMTVVDKIFDELSAKHGDKYTPEQYRCWANLIQLRKHDSYDTTPNKRFFTEKSRGTVTAVSPGVSPSKRINMRSECMSQLDKWHGL